MNLENDFYIFIEFYACFIFYFLLKEDVLFYLFYRFGNLNRLCIGVKDNRKSPELIFLS